MPYQGKSVIDAPKSVRRGVAMTSEQKLRQRLERELQWRMCQAGSSPSELADSFAYFCSHFWHIKHPKGKRLMVLSSAQREAAQAWIAERYTVALKARQIGWTTLASAFAFWECFFWADREEIILSRTQNEAKRPIAMMQFGYRGMPKWMKDRGPKRLSEHQERVAFSNESVIESLPSASDPARGRTVYRVYVDEWAFLPNPDDAWASIEPVADAGGRVVGLSTANGVGNFFFTLCDQARRGENRFKFLFYSWRQAADGRRNDEWYDVQKRTLPEWQLHQEYPDNPDEAFIRSGNVVFDLSVVDALEAREPTLGVLSITNGAENPEFVEYANGELAVWAKPNKDHRYCIGADPAEGLSQDSSVAQVKDVTTGEIVARWRGHIEPDLFGSVVLGPLGWWYGHCLLAVERNNHGHAVIAALTHVGYRNLYLQHRHQSTNQTVTDLYGFLTTKKSKGAIIDELAKALREGTCKVYDDVTKSELRTFVRDPDGKMHGSPHDDCVMSLAITEWMTEHVFLPEFLPPKKDNYFTFDWFVEQAQKVVGGSHGKIGRFNVGQGTARAVR